MFPNNNIPDDDMDRYLNSPIEGPHSDVLEYWKKHKDKPELFKMFQDYGAVMATSASSERVFSAAKEMLGLKRCNLKPNSMEATVCLRSWLRSGLIVPQDLSFEVAQLLNTETTENLEVAGPSHAQHVPTEVHANHADSDLLQQAMLGLHVK